MPAGTGFPDDDARTDRSGPHGHMNGAIAGRQTGRASSHRSGARQLDRRVARTDPECRVRQQRLERQLGRTDERRVDAE